MKEVEAPTRGWLERFMRRHPSLSKRSALPIESARVKAMTMTVRYIAFDLYIYIQLL